jgi:DNA-binding SARP family transcriptional activator/Flp pilus assembly protein TadD
VRKTASRLKQNTVVSLDYARAADHSTLPDKGPVVRIHILGAMRATSYVGKDALPRGRKARAILGCLCLADGARIPRSRLASMLWDRVPDFQARASFRQAFRELVVALGPLANELISADRETIRLETTSCWIDALAVLAPAQDAKSPRANLAALCEGELLEGLNGVSPSFDQWLLSERSQFTEKLRALLEEELKQAHRDTEAEKRADIARRLIRFDPTHEGASRILMRALADMGGRAQALREYARLREELHRALDVEPSPETHALYDALRIVAREEKDKDAPEPIVPRQKRAKQAAPAAPRSRLRVGVLPFLPSGGPQEESLALSLSQEIAAALARFRWFDVIAPVMLITRGTIMPIGDDPLRQNDLDYVVDGAISSDGDKFHISVRLLDLKHYASPVWSNHFDLSGKEPHLVDGDVIAKIAGRIDPVILFIEGQPKRQAKPEATGLLLRAQPLLYSMERDKYDEAGRYIRQALALEPDNAMANAWMAYWHLFFIGQGWPREPAKTIAIVQEHAQRAIRLDPENAEALAIYAHVCAFAHRNFDDALYYFDRALRLNPNLAFAYALHAATYCYIGEPDKAFRQLERYRDLAPFHPYFILLENVFGTAHFLKGEYKEAAAVGRRVVRANPQFVNGFKPLIAALGQLGVVDDAAQYVEALKKLEPGFSLQSFARDYPLKKEYDRLRYIEGLRAAGIPET